MLRYAIAAVALAFLALVAYFVYIVRLGAIEKCQKAGVVSTVDLLEEYRLEHGKYPESLTKWNRIDLWVA